MEFNLIPRLRNLIGMPRVGAETYAFPVLYILVRNDMESMNPGKAMAQASHASNAFIYDIKSKKARLCAEDHEGEMEEFRTQIALADLWENETSQGFGTVLTLAVDEAQMRAAAISAQEAGFTAAVVHDPTYPLIDGNTIHYLPLDTCAYIFGDKNDQLLATIVRNFPLHP